MSKHVWRVGVSGSAHERRDLPRGRCPDPTELLAWDLLEAARPILDKRTRSSLFVTLGAGESGAVIVGVLRTAVRLGHDVPQDLVTRTTAWLDGYVGAEDERPLRELLGRVTASTTTPSLDGHEEPDDRRQ